MFTLVARVNESDDLSHHQSSSGATCEVIVAIRRHRYGGLMARVTVGELIREWRVRRRLSQLDLALEAGVSTRHLSFVETGRSRPSPELLLLIAQHLNIPLRERNSLLLAAGYAPRFPQSGFDDASMAHVRTSIQRMLDAHPYPGVVIDRQWNIVATNASADLLTLGLPDHVIGPPTNVYRLSLHPDGLAARTTNFVEWADHLLRQLRRSAHLTGDPATERLLAEVLAYPNVARLGPVPPEHHETELLVPMRMATPLGELSMFTTLTTFGTPMDVTLSELSIELFFPSDENSERLFRELSAMLSATAL
jgi:transcriptional regulator with XRE-family HTH domain